MSNRFIAAASMCLVVAACGQEQGKQANVENPKESNAQGALTKKPEPQKDQNVMAESTICFGINSCAGLNSCAVDAADVEAAAAVFGERFAKTALHGCATLGSCSAASGQLNRVDKKSDAECFAAGGFLIQEKEGKKTVVQG